MRRVLQWIKTHKIIVVLIIVMGYFLFKDNPRVYPLFAKRISPSLDEQPVGPGSLEGKVDIGFEAASSYAPTTVSPRLVVQNSSLSLLVDDVQTTQTTIIQKTREFGGYMVNSYLSRPQDAPNATITVRLPAKNLDAALAFLRSLGVKVISENLVGEDVTDQYVDIEARLATLVRTQLKFEAIMDQATKVPEILEVQRELINLQTQIDALKGQQNYLAKSSEMAKITVYLSTDELALPYAPTESWRPNVILKEAVRSLIGAFRKLGTAVIWLAVYTVIWLPLAIIMIVYKRKKSKNAPARLN